MGSRDVGVFAHSNAAVFEIGEALNEQRTDHALIGIPEAHAEALYAMAVQCRFGANLASDADIREALALFLTAAVRGKDAPPLAVAIDTGIDLPSDIARALIELNVALRSTEHSDLAQLASVAGQAWDRLRINPGRRAWFRATRHFGRLIAPIRELPVTDENVTRLTDIVQRARTGALIERDYSEGGRVKMMNYHQTKGRVADTVIHVFRSTDYFGPEGEPFTENSRLLNVAVSRARQRVVILLPPVPHGLVHPFTNLRTARAQVQSADASEGRPG